MVVLRLSWPTAVKAFLTGCLVVISGSLLAAGSSSATKGTGPWSQHLNHYVLQDYHSVHSDLAAPKSPSKAHHVHGQGARSRAAAHSNGDVIVVHGMGKRDALYGLFNRRLLHLEAMDASEATDMVETSALAKQVSLYPREAAPVRQYLLDAMKSSTTAVQVPVWFVVVMDPKQPLSAVSKKQAEQQVHLLNRAYATGLPDVPGSVSEDTAGHHHGVLWQFKLMGLHYVTSTAPMCIGSKQAEQVKSTWHPQLIAATLHAEKAAGASSDRVLIIYTSDLTSASCKGMIPGYKALFGWSNTPMELQSWKRSHLGYRDGVVLDYRYLYRAEGPTVDETGSKALKGASTGAQLVHEVGHWMGLMHTFLGGCSTDPAATDGVDDTPCESHPKSWGVDLSDASGGCKPRDTCPGVAGQDPWDNYMNYNNLACARAFTPGQQARMLFLFNNMRAAIH